MGIKVRAHARHFATVSAEKFHDVKSRAQTPHAAQVWCEKGAKDASTEFQEVLRHIAKPPPETLHSPHPMAKTSTLPRKGLATASVVAEPVQSPSAAEPSSSSRVRLDTIYRQQSDLEEERAKAEDKLSELSSAAATERKRAFVVDDSNKAARLPDGTRFTIIDLDTVNSTLLHLQSARHATENCRLSATTGNSDSR
ncbi:hypothetical protein MRX96_012726 [Rhipicephalus microplus]